MIATEEKGSDVSLGAYLVHDAFRHDVDLAVVFTNDSDLRDPIAMLQEPPLSVPVWVVNPHPRKAAALSPTVHLDLKKADALVCQFPRQVRLPSGAAVTRPDAW